MSKVGSLLCALVLLASGCDQVKEVTRADPTESVDAFFASWNLLDFEGMSGYLDVPAGALSRAHERLFEAGRVTELEVARPTDLEEPSEEAYEGEAEVVVEVPYSITYSSDAASEPATLEGSLDWTYSRDEDAWSAEWDKGLLFPGIDGARKLYVATTWPKRAAILDRDRRPLARGAAEERVYPQGSLAGTTVGHIAPLSRRAVRRDPEAGQIGDLTGASGLELAFQERLAGTPSTKLKVIDRRGDVLETLGRTEGDRGRDVRTTLDIDVQRAAEAAYGGTVGGAVVLEPATGDLLAVVSSSPFDPGNYVGVAGIEPFNRALSGLYPPGSSMKVMTAAAALDTGVVKSSTTLTGPAEYRGVRNFESGEFGTLDFATAVKFSVNTAFAQVALDLGAKRIFRYAEAFGFNTEPEMDLAAAASSFPAPADEGDLMWGSIGQAQTLATPLQMATVAATIGNGGKRMEPRVDMRARPTGERVVTKKTAATMVELMENVVQGGTGTGANISGVSVAGKTGTAEVDVAGERKNHAWFICFAPSGDPKVAVAVVSEYGGVGGQVAAPLARAILTGVLPHL